MKDSNVDTDRPQVQEESDINLSPNPSNSFQTLSSFLPKVESLAWPTFFCLSVWCAIPVALYIVFFTQMGWGETFYYALSHQFSGQAYIFAGSLAISCFFFYILDIDEWASRIGNVFRFAWVLAIFTLFVIIVVLKSNEYPFGIITLFAIFDPLWLLMVKSLFYKSKDTRSFVSWLSGPLLFNSFLTAGAFLAWVFASYQNQWNRVTTVEEAERSGCEPNYQDYPNCANQDGSSDTCFYIDYSASRPELVFADGCGHECLHVYNQCSNGFILWAGPVLMCLSMVFLAFFCTFLRTEGSNEKDIFNFAKIWIVLLGLMWASASLSGTSAGVTSSLLCLTLASLVASAIVVSAAFSKKERKDNKEAILSRIQTKYGANNIDVVRGLFVVTCGPIVLVYFFLSAVNQLVRRSKLNLCSQPSSVSDSETNGRVVTVRTLKHITRMRNWNVSKVFTYAGYWGIAYVVMQIFIAKLTIVFLSWMIEKTASLGLIPVTAIMMGVGVVMFLLPPVPGVPVYLTLGIVLTAQGNKTLGYFGCIAYSTAIGLVLKLFSSCLQQKGIGESLSHFVKIRQFVGINSTLMKAMRLVLQTEGLSIPKVAILIGGPDWPTSVLCGIMRLSLPQILLGTVPVVFLIFPTCLTGALLYMASLDTDSGNPRFPWAGTVSTLTASLTACVQFASMFVAAFYLEQTADKRKDEVLAIEDDLKVKEADERDKQMTKCYNNVTQWTVLPLLSKLVLIGSLVSITTCCYMVQFFSNSCFADHELADSIDDNLDGNVANLFMPLGWVAIGLFFGSVVLLYGFCSWGKKQAKIQLDSGKTTPFVSVGSQLTVESPVQ